MWIPAIQDVSNIHLHLTQLFAAEDDPISPSGIRNQDLLESACTRPHTGSGSSDKYHTVDLKLAALFHSLTKNHPFHNGNKRTALAALLAGLSRNDKRLNAEVSDQMLFDFVVAVTAGDYPFSGASPDEVVAGVADWVRQNTTPFRNRPAQMRTSDFVEKCRAAGATVKESPSKVVISTPQKKGIRIRNSTKKLSGPVVRSYMRSLGLHESSTGLTLDEFQDGAGSERMEIRRYMKTMRMLAKT
ncbi:type II toxin-antitoxin system death-on-curing family toxin [Stenotrophomonas maltophilia]|nr:type II toxin-antitoxin system death-on-curing family toxin [Stenotrophomonas maltophilia]MCU1218037.1 type II toxin-antitoxin system death-on-curing family toxin [Stenotrophomonas maltophilia]